MSSFSTLSSPGIGSGLDVNGIVAKLVAIESQPLVKLQQDANRIQTKISAIGQLQSLVTALRDAAQPLMTAATYTGTVATSSNAAAVGVTSTSSALAGDYDVAVTTLAAAQTLVSAQGQFTAGTDVVGTGTLTLRLGSWNGDLSAFTPKTGSSDVAITIAAGDDTLEKIRDKINAAAAGVTASIVTDAGGARLSLRSTATGAENGFRLMADDDDGNDADAAGLSRLAYDPAGGAAQMTRAQAAANAAATINGVPVTSTTNAITGAVDGLTFNLLATTTSAARVSVTANSGAVTSAVNAFVNAYNGVAKFFTEATKYDEKTKTGALFQGDSAVVSLQTQMRSLLTQVSYGSPQYATLSSLGVQLQADGTLKTDATKLAAAVANGSEVRAAFSTSDAAMPQRNGFAVRFDAWADGLLEATGALPSRKTSLQASADANARDQARLADRVGLYEQRLRAQYTALDTTMSKYTALNSYVTQQMDLLAAAAKRSASS